MLKSINFPCPICKKSIHIIGTDSKNRKIGSCGCVWKFKKTKSQKIMDKTFVKTAWGLERI